MTEEEVRRIVRETVIETLTTLGIDVSEPEGVIAAQADFAYLRKSRSGAEELAKWLRRGAVGTALSALAVLLWEGLRGALDH